MRTWINGISPAQGNKLVGLYENTQWLRQMDRDYESDDGFSVTTRLLRTPWGKVEHASIQHISKREVTWAEKQEIKDELFPNKLAIEVFPPKDHLVDVCNVYHLWVFEKGFKLPFGIHPKDNKAVWVSRGVCFSEEDAKKLEELLAKREQKTPGMGD